MARLIPSGLRKELWTSPRTSMRFILNINSKQNTFLFPFIFTVLWLFPVVYKKKLVFLQDFTSTQLFFIAICCGFMGILASHIIAAILNLSAQLLGARSSFNRMLSALSWFLYTTIPAVVCYYAICFWETHHDFLNFLLIAMLAAGLLYSLSLFTVFLSVASRKGLVQTLFLPACIAALAIMLVPNKKMSALLFKSGVKGYDFYLSEFQTRFLLDKLSVSLLKDNPEILKSNSRLPVAIVKHSHLAPGSESFRIDTAHYESIAPNLDLYFLNKHPRWAFMLYAYTSDRKLLAAWRMNRKREFCRVYISKTLNIDYNENNRCQNFKTYSKVGTHTRPKLTKHD